MSELLALIVGFAVLLVMLPFLIFGYFHTTPALNAFAQQLSEAMPANTKTIDSVSEFGTVTGNGDHCDFLAGVLVETEMNRDDFEEYVRANYKDNSTNLRFTWWSGKDADASIRKPDYANFWPLRDIALRNITAPSNQVLVYTYKPDAVFDFRCL